MLQAANDTSIDFSLSGSLNLQVASSRLPIPAACVGLTAVSEGILKQHLVDSPICTELLHLHVTLENTNIHYIIPKGI